MLPPPFSIWRKLFRSLITFRAPTIKFGLKICSDSRPARKKMADSLYLVSHSFFIVGPSAIVYDGEENRFWRPLEPVLPQPRRPRGSRGWLFRAKIPHRCSEFLIVSRRRRFVSAGQGRMPSPEIKSWGNRDFVLPYLCISGECCSCLGTWEFPSTAPRSTHKEINFSSFGITYRNRKNRDSLKRGSSYIWGCSYREISPYNADVFFDRTLLA